MPLEAHIAGRRTEGGSDAGRPVAKPSAPCGPLEGVDAAKALAGMASYRIRLPQPHHERPGSGEKVMALSEPQLSKLNHSFTTLRNPAT